MEEIKKQTYDISSIIDAYNFVNDMNDMNDNHGYAEGKWCGKNWVGCGGKPNDDNKIKLLQEFISDLVSSDENEYTVDDWIFIIGLSLGNYKSYNEHQNSKKTVIERGKMDINYINCDLHKEEEEKIVDLTEKCTIKDKKIVELEKDCEILKKNLNEAKNKINDEEKSKWDLRCKIMKEIEEKKEKEISFIKDELKHYQERVETLSNERKSMVEQQQLILNLRDEHTKRVSEDRAKEILQKLEEKDKELKHFKALHVNVGKGPLWEREILPEIENMNTKELGGVYEVKHVGQWRGGMGDFILTNKLTKQAILVDMKNNQPNKPVTNIDIAKFKSDIEECNVIGGIMVARNKITCKALYEEETLGGKKGVYISKFHDLHQLFWTIKIMETTFSGDENNVEKLGQIEEFMEDEYEIEQKKIMKLKREIKTIEARAHTREELYFQWFGKDIAISKCNVLQTKKEKENIIDFKNLEEGKTEIIGRQSKFYLEYNKGDKLVLQYFPSLYAKKAKMKNLVDKNREAKKLKQTRQQKKSNETIKIETETENLY